jgi:cystathionine beta-synthase
MAGLLQLRDHFTDQDVIVVIFHDHGTRYLGKMFNDDWMKKKGFLQREGLTARDLVANKRTVPLVTVEHTDTIAHVAQVMTAHDFSQIPVTSNGRIVGSVNEAKLYAKMVHEPSSRTQPVDTVMQGAFPFLDITAGVDALALMLTPENPAVLVRDFKTDETWVITRSDVIQALS